MQLAEHLDESAEVLALAHVKYLVQSVLVDDTVLDLVEPVLHALGGFVSDLDAHLEHAQREFVGGVARHPQSKLVVDQVWFVSLGFLEFRL